jgi:hypothetical protein
VILNPGGPVDERWFVYDPDHGWQDYDSEETARGEFLTVINAYRDEAAADAWPDAVEGIMWGKIFQTTSLLPVNPPENADPDEFEGKEFAEVFITEHRKLS